MCWLNGQYPAGTNDKTTFGDFGLKEAIKEMKQELPDFCIIADDGCFQKDFCEFLAYRNELDPQEIAWFKDRALSCHESFNKLTKNYACLAVRFRHDHTSGNYDHQHPMHKACVEAVCVTIQCEFDEGEKMLLNPCPSKI